MTLTEAAACGTPAVATRIAGHVDAVVEGVSGLLADDEPSSPAHLVAVATDPACATACRAGALRPRRAASPGRPPPRAILTALADEARGAGGADPGASRRPSTGDARRLGHRRLAAAARLPWRRPGRRSAAVCYVPLLLTHPGQVGADTKSYLYHRPRPAARAGRWSMWDPQHRDGHRHPPEHRLPVADGPLVLGLRAAAACPTGWPSACGSARSCSSPALGVRHLMRTLGRDGPHVMAAVFVYALSPYVLVRRAASRRSCCRGRACRG